jgi:hypothetical protein
MYSTFHARLCKKYRPSQFDLRPCAAGKGQGGKGVYCCEKLVISKKFNNFNKITKNHALRIDRGSKASLQID